MSLLESLAARKAEIQAEQVKDLAVPLWHDPVIRLRVKPVDHAIIRGITMRASKAKGGKASEAELNANAAIINAGTVTVLLEPDDDAEMTLSDPELVEALGLPEGSEPTQVIRGIVLRDGDLITLADAVIRHSGYVKADVDDDFFEG